MSDYVNSRTLLKRSPVVFLVIGGVIVLFLVFSAWRTIQPGYVGIVFDKINHQVTSRQLEPGWAFVNPFSQDIREYPVTIITYSMVQKSSEGRVSGDDSIKIQSSEGQQLNLDVVVQYQVIKTEAAELYTDWGGAKINAVEDSVVRQYTRSQVPIVASKYADGAYDTVHPGENGLIVDPEDTDALAEAIDSILSSEEIQRRYSQNCRQYIPQFEFEAVMQGYLQAIALAAMRLW